jgi:hypothetical protein
MGNRYAEVSRRACYLFCRFVKPLRGQIAPRLPEVGPLYKLNSVDPGGLNISEISEYI